MAVTGALAFVVVAVLLVPWDPIPGLVRCTRRLRPRCSRPNRSSAPRTTRVPSVSSSWASLAVSLAVACVLGFSGIGARFVDRVRGPWWWLVVVAVAALALVGRLATLPFLIVLRHRALDFGLTNQGWGASPSTWPRASGWGVVATSIALVVLVGVARRWPRAWPAAAGVLLAGLVMLGSFVYPLLVEPLFNHFEPLPDGPLRTQVLALADQEGVRVDDVWWPTPLDARHAERLRVRLRLVAPGGRLRQPRRRAVDDDREILSVVAHELGHARHDDVLTGSLLGAAGALLGVGLLGLLVGGLADPRQVPRVLALMAIAALLASPVENGISRRIETRADVASLRATDDPEAFIEVQKELALRSLADPTPYAWSQFWFGSHPTDAAADRPCRAVPRLTPALLKCSHPPGS